MRARLTRPINSYVPAWAAAEFPVLSAILAVVVGGFAFAQIAGEVLEGDTRGFDEAVLLFFRDPADLADPIGPAWLESAVRDVTALGGFTVLSMLTLILLVYLLLIRKKASALLVLVSITGGMLLSDLLKSIFARPRPELVAHLVEVQTESFPSGHAMLSAVTYLTLGALLARTESTWSLKIYFIVVAVVLTVMVGSSRVYLGVHYPTDVLAGWSVGAAWALLCWAVAYRLQRRGTVEPSS